MNKNIKLLFLIVKPMCWLEDGPDQNLRDDVIVVGGMKDNISLATFLTSKWNVLDFIESKVCEHMALLCKVQGDRLLARNSGTVLSLKKDSVLWSRPGIYISNQANKKHLTKTKDPRTHYVGEGKNLAKRLANRTNRKIIFEDGAEITVIFKSKGIVNDDYLFVHEVRTTCERFISEKIEEKLKPAECNNKPSWCMVHKKGRKQIDQIQKFVEQLIKDKHVS
jgi:hypothetical protein